MSFLPDSTSFAQQLHGVWNECHPAFRRAKKSPWGIASRANRYRSRDSSVLPPHRWSLQPGITAPQIQSRATLKLPRPRLRQSTLSSTASSGRGFTVCCRAAPASTLGGIRSFSTSTRKVESHDSTVLLFDRSKAGAEGNCRFALVAHTLSSV